MTISFCCLPLAWTFAGCSPGKALVGLRVVNTSGSWPSFSQSMVRVICYWLSAAPLFLGFIWALVDNHHQTWHDKLAGTYVIYHRKGHGGRA